MTPDPARPADPAPGATPDNPEMDGTDFAHPAWWRGHDQTAVTLTRRYAEILDGKDDGAGVMSGEVEVFRRRLMALLAERDALRRAVRSAFDQFDRIQQFAGRAASGEKWAPSFKVPRNLNERQRAAEAKAAYDCATIGMRETLAALAAPPAAAGEGGTP